MVMMFRLNSNTVTRTVMVHRADSQSRNCHPQSEETEARYWSQCDSSSLGERIAAAQQNGLALLWCKTCDPPRNTTIRDTDVIVSLMDYDRGLPSGRAAIVELVVSDEEGQELWRSPSTPFGLLGVGIREVGIQEKPMLAVTNPITRSLFRRIKETVSRWW